jgi:hypothetical protein
MEYDSDIWILGLAEKCMHGMNCRTSPFEVQGDCGKEALFQR